MSGKRKSCASAYRREAARLVIDTGRSIALATAEQKRCAVEARA